MTHMYSQCKVLEAEAVRCNKIIGRRKLKLKNSQISFVFLNFFFRSISFKFVACFLGKHVVSITLLPRFLHPLRIHVVR